jgi:Ferritin-like protein
MLDKNVADLINQQVNKEFYSAYLYMDFSNYYYDQGLDGYGNWFKVQYQEERDHAVLMNQYLLNNSMPVTLDAIAKPDKKITCIKDPLLFSLEHERYVTNLINIIYEAAHKADDFRTMQFLDWFVKEQGEEEKNAETNIKKYDLFGSDPKGLYQLDQEMLARVYAAPSLII